MKRHVLVGIRSLAHVVKYLLPVKISGWLYRAGCFLYKEDIYPSMEATFKYMSSWGFNPSTTIDIGAYNGEWTRDFKKIFPASKVLMIEGQEGKSDLLRQVCLEYADEVKVEIALLGASDHQEVEFFEMETGSSVYEEASLYKRERIKKELVSLDSLIEHKYGEFKQLDFLKLDVQGYELEVLMGAKRLLKQTEFVLIEASLIPINKGCPMISEVIGFMVTERFRLFDFCSQIRRKDNALWQTDLLFVSEVSKFIPKAVLDTKNWG